MNRTKRIGVLGGLAAVAAAATPFVYLWVLTMSNADDPPTARVRLDTAIALVAGFVLVVRLRHAGMTFDAGVMSYLLYGPILVILTGSAAPPPSAGRSARGSGPAHGPPCWARR